MFHLQRQLKLPLTIVSRWGLALVDRSHIIQPIVNNVPTILSLPTYDKLTNIITKRFIDCNTKCPKTDPPCTKKKTAEKVKCDLMDTKIASTKKKTPKPKKKKSMWENPECCVVRCILPERIDITRYRPSNPHKRKYVKTWVSCAKVKAKPRCKPIKFIYPKSKRRTFKRKHSKTTCVSSNSKFAKNLMPCSKVKKSVCPKVGYKNCRMARNPPRCSKKRDPSDCTKVFCPWPSFSECDHPKLRKSDPEECFCLARLPLCEVYRYMRKMRSIRH